MKTRTLLVLIPVFFIMVFTFSPRTEVWGETGLRPRVSAPLSASRRNEERTTSEVVKTPVDSGVSPTDSATSAVENGLGTTSSSGEGVIADELPGLIRETDENFTPEIAPKSSYPIASLTITPVADETDSESEGIEGGTVGTGDGLLPSMGETPESGTSGTSSGEITKTDSEPVADNGDAKTGGESLETDSSSVKSDQVANEEDIPLEMRPQKVAIVPKVEEEKQEESEKKPEESENHPGAGISVIDNNAHAITVLKQLTGPQQTVRFFLDSCRSQNYEDAVRSMDFSDMPELNLVDRHDYAFKLFGILNRLDNFDLTKIPKNYDSDLCYLWPDQNYKALILERHEDGTWKFSASTIADIPAIYNEIRDKRANFLKDSWLGDLPDFFFYRYASLTVLQWIILLIFILLGYLALKIIPIVSSRLIMIFARIRGDKDYVQLYQWALRPLAYFGMAWIWFAGLRFIGVKPKILILGFVILHPLCVVILTLTFLRLVDIFRRWLQIRLNCSVNKVKSVLVDLSSGVIKFVIICVAVIAIAQIFGISPLGIVSGMGIGGIAVALAAQQTIANFFGSMTILLDHPFTVGDYIIVGNIEGVVERIGLRSTSIKTFYESHVVIPNGQLATDVIDNMGRRQSRRFKTTLGLQYDTPVPLIEAFSAGVRRLIEKHPHTRKDDIRVNVNDFGPSSIDILFICYFVVRDVHEELKNREELILDIITLANELGVSFAFPTQTSYLIPSENLTYPMNKEVTEGESAIEAGRNLAEEIFKSHHQK